MTPKCRVALRLIFSTKDRIRALAYPELQSQLEVYIVGILKNLGCPTISTRAVVDHVHTLVFLSRTDTIVNVET